ncbi:MAG TPA: hypothetical protein DIW81_07555 [Planctomycetaceae bacterium]|nr:hypothetical protein [Rubinisphaera sp.]HCS51435.1 hypothetical protein [Planctomycetaceae bacterium]
MSLPTDNLALIDVVTMLLHVIKARLYSLKLALSGVTVNLLSYHYRTLRLLYFHMSCYISNGVRRIAQAESLSTDVSNLVKFKTIKYHRFLTGNSQYFLLRTVTECHLIL